MAAVPTSTDVRTLANHGGGAWAPEGHAVFTESGGAARAYRYGVEAGMVEFHTRKKVVTSRWAA